MEHEREHRFEIFFDRKYGKIFVGGGGGLQPGSPLPPSGYGPEVAQGSISLDGVIGFPGKLNQITSLSGAALATMSMLHYCFPFLIKWDFPASQSPAAEKPLRPGPLMKTQPPLVFFSSFRNKQRWGGCLCEKPSRKKNENANKNRVGAGSTIQPRDGANYCSHFSLFVARVAWRGKRANI